MDIIKIDTYSFYRSVYPPVGSNMYILFEGEEAIVVDSNINEEVAQLLCSNNINKVHLFLTHEHYDHSYGVRWFKDNYSTTLYCHEGCKGLLSTNKNCSPQLVSFVLASKDKIDGGHSYEDFKKQMTAYELTPDVYFRDNETLDIAGHKIKIIHVPGHTPGSSLLVMDEKLVFTGDSLIQDNKIITSFRGGCKEDMLNIALPKLKQLPDDLTVMPGHGAPFKKKEFNFNIYNV